MIKLLLQLDIITWLAECRGKEFVVWEFENDFALSLHLQERAAAQRS